jgi:hypothetical protein
MKYRIKLVSPVGDCHYFYANDRDMADKMMNEICEDIKLENGFNIYLYVETRHGHVRVS